MTKQHGQITKSIFTGYASLIITSLYVLVSVPLTLTYLTKEEFGLWALITQITGYLTLLEFGISGAVARFLSDFKDDIDGGNYGRVLVTGFRVFIIQSIFIIIIGIAISLAGPKLLSLPEHLHTTFTSLTIAQSVITGISLITRSLACPLWPNQRQDILYKSSIISIVTSFVFLWICLHLNLKLTSLIIASLASLLSGTILSVHACIKLKFYPKQGCWGSFDYTLFKKMSNYARSIFMLNMGWQLISASQVIIVSRTMGLESASIWAISTKLSTMVQQFALKIYDATASSVAEIIVRNDIDSLRIRSKSIIQSTSAVAALGAIGIMYFNNPIIKIWAKNQIYWDNYHNLLLAINVYLFCITRTQIAIISLNKNLKSVKYTTIIEGICFISIAFCYVPKYGFKAVLIASLATNALVSGVLSSLTISNQLRQSFSHTLKWSKASTLIFISTIVFLLIFTNFVFQSNLENLQNLFNIIIYIGAIIPAVWHFCIPIQFKDFVKVGFYQKLSRFQFPKK